MPTGADIDPAHAKQRIAAAGEPGAVARPRPPASLLSIDGVVDGKSFVPALDLVEWISATFLEEGAPLENLEHAHLRMASIGALWTTTENVRNGQSIVGQAELGQHIGGMGKWNRAKAVQQAEEWFGCVPDFILTFYAPYADSASDATFCALVEHELSHCGQENDEFGIPRFKKSTGMPAFCMRPHDVEEFISVVRRYGSDAAGVRAMIDAAAEGPTIAAADIGFACGNCLK
jgi:Putative phage metallopeptidase